MLLLFECNACVCVCVFLSIQSISGLITTTHCSMIGQLNTMYTHRNLCCFNYTINKVALSLFFFFSFKNATRLLLFLSLSSFFFIYSSPCSPSVSLSFMLSSLSSSLFLSLSPFSLLPSSVYLCSSLFFHYSPYVRFLSVISSYPTNPPPPCRFILYICHFSLG